MIRIHFKSLLIGVLLIMSSIIFMGAYDVLDRFKKIQAKEIQIIDEQGLVVLSLSDFSRTIEKLEERIIELENKEADPTDNSIYDNFENKWAIISKKIDALSSDFLILEDDLEIIKNLKGGVSDELDKQSSDLSRIDREAVRYHRLVKRIEDKVARMDEDIKNINGNCATPDQLVDYLSSYPHVDPEPWVAQEGCAPLLLNCPDLCDDIQAIIDDFEEDKAEFFYKYYKASRRAEQDMKNEKKKKKKKNN